MTTEEEAELFERIKKEQQGTRTALLYRYIDQKDLWKDYLNFLREQDVKPE